MKVSKFISHLPALGLVMQALNYSLLKSKNPDIINIYSFEKFIAILSLLLASVLWIIFLSSHLESFILYLKNKFTKKYNFFHIYIFFSLIAGLYIYNDPCKVGEDVAKQVLSSQLYLDDKVKGLNYDVLPVPSDLSQTKQKWILRPPGMSFLLIPFMCIGIPLGLSLKITLFLLHFSSCLGWLFFAYQLRINHKWLIFLAIFLSFGFFNLTFNFSTASIVTSATLPWLLIWAIKLSRFEFSKRPKTFVLIQSLFFLVLGFHAFFKLSSLIVLTAVAILPLVLIHKDTFKFSRKLYIPLFTSLFFLVPYFFSNLINYRITGAGNDIYLGQDFNAQHELWGRYITETTKGPFLLASLIASFGYYSPAQSLLHGFRDFMLQFDTFIVSLHTYEINPKIFSICLASTPISILLLVKLFRIKNQITTNEWYTYFFLLTLPSLGFGFVSYLHGFNYLIYPGYSQEYGIIFFLLGLSIVSSTSWKKPVGFRSYFLIYILLGIPIIKLSSSLGGTFLNDKDSVRASDYENEIFLGPSKFSKSLQIVAQDSNSSLDVCIFLCSENYGDYCLRTEKRSISIHFANDNLKLIPKFDSSEPLNAYCILSPKLAENQSFISLLLAKFPLNSKATQLDHMTWKFNIKPTNET